MFVMSSEPRILQFSALSSTVGLGPPLMFTLTSTTGSTHTVRIYETDTPNSGKFFEVSWWSWA